MYNIFIYTTALLHLAATCIDGVLAQGGGALDGYKCDPTSCRLPDCLCASTSPPGGLSPDEVPQFVVFTADDAIQSYTLDAVNQFLAQRANPNGCKPRMTYFTSIEYTNYSQVTGMLAFAVPRWTLG